MADERLMISYGSLVGLLKKCLDLQDEIVQELSTWAPSDQVKPMSQRLSVAFRSFAVGGSCDIPCDRR